MNLHDVHLEHEAERWRGSFDLELYLYGQKQTSLRTINLDLSEEELKSALQTPYAILTRLPPGATGQLRIVVRDRATGNAGSLWMQVN